MNTCNQAQESLGQLRKIVGLSKIFLDIFDLGRSHPVAKGDRVVFHS